METREVMRRSFRENFELGLNILIAIAVVTVAAVVVKRYVFPSPASARPTITQGTRLTVPNVSWEQNQKTLVFFLMKDCKFCTASAPFYRQLIDEGSKRNVKMLAILPDRLEAAKEYLRSTGLPIENVQSADLSSYNVSSTPTVLFVNSQGVVSRVWVGAPPAREKEMKDELLALFDGQGSAK
jgi:peroxiredoxin